MLHIVNIQLIYPLCGIFSLQNLAILLETIDPVMLKIGGHLQKSWCGRKGSSCIYSFSVINPSNRVK